MRTPIHQVSRKAAITATTINNPPNMYRFSFLRAAFLVKRMWAAGGIIVKATITEAIRAKVLVKARGLKSLPSAPVIVKTGKKLTMVVETAVRTAPPTSLAALKTTSSLLSSGAASSRCFRIFSQMIMPISTIVPMAIAMPDSATIFASTPKVFIAIKHISTAKGSRPLMSTELLRCTTKTITTMIVTRISSVRAVFNVPKVS